MNDTMAYVRDKNASDAALGDGGSPPREELRDFIYASLSQITKAIADFTKDHNGIATAVPNFKTFDPEAMAQVGIVRVAERIRRGIVGGNESRELLATKFAAVVRFEVAVTVEKGTTNKGGAGIKVFAANLDGSTERHNEDARISRLSFSIPLQIHRYAVGEQTAEDATTERMNRELRAHFETGSFGLAKSSAAGGTELASYGGLVNVSNSSMTSTLISDPMSFVLNPRVGR